VKILVDTNVFLDVLLAREKFLIPSQQVCTWCEERPGSGWVAWHTLSNLSFIGNKLAGKKRTTFVLDHILDCFEVAPTSSEAARASRSYGFNDFEDALQAAAAVACKVDWIITRNQADFKKSPIKAISPKAFMAQH